MSFPVNLQGLPVGVFEEVFGPENMRSRTAGNSLTAMSFPKCRSALWDGRPAGEMFHLQLCSYRKPRLLLLEKALRLAQRHARHSNKSNLHCFFLGTASVDTDEEGVTVTLDRFDPGRDQAGASGRVPSALLPGDVLVPCLFSSQTQTTSDTVIQSEADLHQCFKVLQQYVSSRQALDLSQLLKVKGHVFCWQQADASNFSLSWSAVCPSVGLDVQPVRPVPIILTALLRSLTSIGRPLPHASNRQRGFLTMDQTRKLLLLLESDPKASKLPLVGLWLSGVTHVYNPQVWAWCLRFLFGSALQDRVLSESGSFLLVVFGSAQSSPQFFQCQGSRPGPGPRQLDCQLLSASQSLTVYQVAPMDGQTLQCELTSEHHSRQMQVFRGAQSSFRSAAPPAAGLSVSDQDSGVEDEDLSPRPSPSPHLPAQQARRVQPSVPELSLLMDSSFTSSNQNAWQDTGSTHLPPPPPADKTSDPPTRNATSSSASTPLRHHSTPNSNLQQTCACCSSPHIHDCTSIYPHEHHPANPPQPAPSQFLTPPQPATSQLLTRPQPAPSHHLTPPQPAPFHTLTAPTSAAPPCSTRRTPHSSHHPASPPSSAHPAALLANNPSSSPSSHHHTPPASTPVLPAPCPCSHPAPVRWYGDSPSPHHASPPWLPHPSSVNQQQPWVVPSEAYQLLLNQDHQLRLLQAQVQMLLEAQGKLQSSSPRVDTHTPRCTANVAVGTGASLLWEDPVQPLPHQEVQATALSTPSTPSFARPPPPSSSSPRPPPSPSSRDLSIIRPVDSAEDGDITCQEGPCSPLSPHRVDGLQSPVLGESASMFRRADEQQSFYHNLMTQLASRLQESDGGPEVEESRKRSLSVVPDCSHLSRMKQPICEGDVVVSTTLQQLEDDVDREDVIESDRRIHKTLESSSTLACINQVAVLSRLSETKTTASISFPGRSVDLSLEANGITLGYLSDTQLSRLSLGGHTPSPGHTSSKRFLLSPSNMTLATRKFMKSYDLIEEEDGEEEEDDVQESSTRQPLTETMNLKLLPQSQLMRDLRPKMQVLANSAKPNKDKENCSSKRPSLVSASSRQMEGSIGNILDLSRLRELPKLF